MKIIKILIIFMFFCEFAFADTGMSISKMHESIKTKEVKLEFESSSSIEYWGWISVHFDSISRAQIEWGSRDINDEFTVISPIGINKKITINSQTSLEEAICAGLLCFDCIAIISENKLIVLPNSIKLDNTYYKKINNLIYYQSKN